MFDALFQNSLQRYLGSGGEDIKCFLPYMGMAAILVDGLCEYILNSQLKGPCFRLNRV